MRISDWFANFVVDFVRVSPECPENFHVSRTNVLKNLMRIFSPKIIRKTVVRRSCDVCANVANLSPRNFGLIIMVAYHLQHSLKEQAGTVLSVFLRDLGLKIPLTSYLYPWATHIYISP